MPRGCSPRALPSSVPVSRREPNTVNSPISTAVRSTLEVQNPKAGWRIGVGSCTGDVWLGMRGSRGLVTLVGVTATVAADSLDSTALTRTLMPHKSRRDAPVHFTMDPPRIYDYLLKSRQRV